MTANKTALAGLALSTAICVVALATPARPALACGDAEGSGSCAGATAAADEARWMLDRVASAVRTDEPRALDLFIHGQGGFRTQDTYVFCIGPDGRVSAHPDPKVLGQDARTLRDPTGKAFAAEMLGAAREGAVTEVHYLYPRPGSDAPVAKTSYVTRAKDQVCGVGAYDANGVPMSPGSTASAQAARLAQLRQQLDADIPAGLRPEWMAFVRALDAQHGAQGAALAKTREGVATAEAALAAP